MLMKGTTPSPRPSGTRKSEHRRGAPPAGPRLAAAPPPTPAPGTAPITQPLWRGDGIAPVSRPPEHWRPAPGPTPSPMPLPGARYVYLSHVARSLYSNTSGAGGHVSSHCLLLLSQLKLDNLINDKIKHYLLCCSKDLLQLMI